VRRAFIALEARGWIEIDRSAGGRNNSFQLTFPVDDNVAPLREANGDKGDWQPVTNATVNGASSSPLETNLETKGGNEEKNHTPTICEEKRNTARSDLFDSPRSPSVEKEKQQSASEPLIEDAFAQFWAAYPRHVAKGDARIAFAKAIKAGADPAAIIGGARRYNAERAGQEPQYTAYPRKWLRAERWTDEPAAVNGALVIDQGGNPASVERPRENRNRRGWLDIVAGMEAKS
jgi:hypothetical protein